MTQISIEQRDFDSLTDEQIAAWKLFTGTNGAYASPFFQIEFASAVNKCCNNVIVFICSQDSSIVALLALQKVSVIGMVSSWERLGGEMNDYLSPIVRRGYTISLHEILDASSVHFLHYSHYPAELSSYGESGVSVASRINIEADGVAYLSWLESTNKKYYSDSLRRERKCVREVGELTFLFQDDTAGLVDTIIREKRNQYLRTNVSDSLDEEWKRKLLLELSGNSATPCRHEKHCDEKNVSGIQNDTPLNGHDLARYEDRDDISEFKCVVSSLLAGEEWIAYHIGLHAGGILQYWFPVYNQKFRQYAPGRLLLLATIRAAEKNQIQMIDRGDGLSSEKQQTANVLHLMKKDTYSRKSIESQCHRLITGVQWRIDKWKTNNAV